MLTLPQVAERLNLSADSVRRLIDAGRLEAVNVSAGARRRWRVQEDALQRFIEASRSATPQPQHSGRAYRSRWCKDA